MKITHSDKGCCAVRGRSGIALLDCMIYLALFSLVATLAFAAFFHTHDNSKRLNRNADDIVSALRAGERWRTDVRSSISGVQILQSDRETVMVLPQATGEVRYILKKSMLSRQTSAGAATNPVVLLQGVKSSSMQPDRRKDVLAWRWELELNGSQKAARVLPLFTFTAVPAGHKL